MAKKKAVPPIKAEATAKAELAVKAIYQRKHSTTEVIPPDVTRAKAGAWLDIISPITEWAGLKGDELHFKRQQLRIQREAALEQLAVLVDRKMKAGTNARRNRNEDGGSTLRCISACSHRPPCAGVSGDRDRQAQRPATT